VRRCRGSVLALSFLIVAGCSSGAPAAVPFQKVRTVPEPRTGPFVISAIDNHFHDIHLNEHKEIAHGRPISVQSYGLHLHNFTLEGTNISVDIPPGGRVLIGILPVGHYEAFCKYHVNTGMRGRFDVVP
jgi:hypothetical protein